MMELIVPFRQTDFSKDGTHLPSDRFIMEIQREWEESFNSKFSPFYANAIEGHPSAMLRLTRYMDAGEETEYDFGSIRPTNPIFSNSWAQFTFAAKIRVP